MFLKEKMNKTNCTQPDKKLFEDTVLPILYILVFIVGLLLNVWGMTSLLQDWKKLRNIKIFVFNLGLADMFYLFTLPFLIVYYLKGSKWIFGDIFCKVTRYCFKVNLYCSIGFLTCISVYRYLAIVHPMKVLGKLTTTHSVVISVMVWILVGAQSLPDMFYPKHSENKTEQCFDTTDFKNVEKYLKYSLSVTFIGFCIPLGIIGGCYGHMSLVVCRSNSITKVKKQQFIKLFVFMILLFLLCYTPYHFFKNLNLHSRLLIHWNICPAWNSGVFIAHQASRGLVSLNSALNPLVYLHIHEDMGVQVKQLLKDSKKILRHRIRQKSKSVSISKTEEETLSLS